MLEPMLVIFAEFNMYFERKLYVPKHPLARSSTSENGQAFEKLWLCLLGMRGPYNVQVPPILFHMSIPTYQVTGSAITT